jgi:hypothetical protein
MTIVARLAKYMLGTAVLLGAAFLFGDTRLEMLRTLVSLEKKNLGLESRRLGDLSRRLETAASELSLASRAASEAAAREGEFSEPAEALLRAASAVRDLVGEERLALDRIAVIRQKITDLEREIGGGRGRRDDALSGDWKIRVEPGEQDGDMRLFLDGTLVSGDYSLQGGYSGSFRGTLVGDRLKLERIDSKLGFNSVYYGRLNREAQSMSGTWEATDLSAGSVTSGSWSAKKKPTAPEER